MIESRALSILERTPQWLIEYTMSHSFGYLLFTTSAEFYHWVFLICLSYSLWKGPLSHLRDRVLKSVTTRLVGRRILYQGLIWDRLSC
jgi:hypothetical protein